MDPIFIIELIIVATIIVLQFRIFVNNRSSINEYEDLFPAAQLLKTQNVPIEEEGEIQSTGAPEHIQLIADQKEFTSRFRGILQNTNAYLKRNRGAADFNILKEMAEKKAEALEDSIEANIPLPLYIGLLCTFTGVIIGLVKIAMVGVSDAAIQSFIGGVLIGMIGSAAGLTFTVRSNFQFKESKKASSRSLYDYFSFLRTYILPALKKEPGTTLGSLRDNLTAFNEGFTKYQGNMNQSLTETLRLFSELKEVFKQIRSIEQGLNGMNHFLQSNEGMIEKQMQYIASYSSKAEEFTRKLGEHIGTVDKTVGSMVDENIKALDKSTQAAFVKMDHYLRSLDGADRKSFAESLNKDLSEFRGELDHIQEKSVRMQAQIIEQMNQAQRHDKDLNEQIRGLNHRLDQVISEGGTTFGDSFAMKLFVYSGAAAFLMGLGGGIFYILNYFSV